MSSRHKHLRAMHPLHPKQLSTASNPAQAPSNMRQRRLTARRMTIIMRRLEKRSRLWAMGCTL